MTDPSPKRIKKTLYINIGENDVYVDAICFDMVVAQRDAARRRIEKLEAALREITWIATPDQEEARHKATEIARKALEGKDE